MLFLPMRSNMGLSIFQEMEIYIIQAIRDQTEDMLYKACLYW
jgi:hypothetical protein